LNPDCEAIAAALDRERKERGPRGPLHGVPILIKDNIDTRDKMMTTAGSLALIGSKPSSRRVRREKTPRCGRGHSRQNQSQRMGQLSFE
jgi:Asp-tRNA(Asn)/Glu-tRNA(Gln) amidotransferase A subunit family amidase